MNGDASGRVCTVIVLLAALMLAGCTEVGEPVTEPFVVEPGGAQRANIDLIMSAGKLNVTGGATALLEADVAYNIPSWRPNVTYNVKGEAGNLLINQPGAGTVVGAGNVIYDWNVRVNEKVPLDMVVRTDNGVAFLTLGNVNMDTLDIDIGASEVLLDFKGKPRVRRIDLDLGAGDTTVDLNGTFGRDLDAHFKVGIGALLIKLPSGYGIHLETKGGIGSITPIGFQMRGTRFMNDRYGRPDTNVNLRIAIETSIGDITVEMIDTSDGEYLSDNPGMRR